MRDEILEQAYTILKVMIGSESLTHTQIVDRAKRMSGAISLTKQELDAVVARYEFNHGNVIVRPPTTLVKDKSDGEWFDRRRRLLEGRKQEGFFERYSAFLQAADIHPNVIAQIKKDAEDTLRHCANPEGSIDVDQRKRRGLVVGDVQSGKTMNYLGLVNLACDYGYKVILILAGMTDSLRQQTQGRFDEGFIGAVSRTISSSDVKFIGVGVHANGNRYHAVPLTNNDYDFLAFSRKTNNASVEDFSKPVVFVVKKNAPVLKEIAQWLLKSSCQATKQSLLIIDDEADNASVNCRKEGSSPTAINRGIRDLFNQFKVASYIGFTATPFANIFINPEDDTSYKDLFPSDFITLLEPPSLYFGAGKVFSFDGERNAPCIRLLDVNEPDFFPVKHKKGEFHFVTMPKSMKEAVLSFLIGCAVRTARGAGKKHRSMMINISVLNDIQDEICDCVSRFVQDLQSDVAQTIGMEEEFLRCENMKWLRDIYMGVGKYAGDRDFFRDVRESRDKRLRVSWEELKKHLLSEVEAIRVAVINNKKKGEDRFSYEPYKDAGARVIAIGGYVLSRGLTLEGLMVSYFSRNATAYDSLLQMCRWFGYRPGYEDICRVYISPQNVMNFRAVVTAVEDLKTQFRVMKLQDAKPESFGLMVKESPDSLDTKLLITSRNKMQSTMQKQFVLNYSGVAADTSKLGDGPKEIADNFDAVRRLGEEAARENVKWERVKMPTGRTSRKMLCNVPNKLIASFVSELKVPSENTKFDTKSLSDFIARTRQFPLWDVVISSGDASELYEGEHLNIRSFRKDSGEPIRIGDTNNRLLNPKLFESGLTSEQMDQVRKNAEERVLANGTGDKNLFVSSDYLHVKGRKPIVVIYPIKLRPVEGKDVPASSEELEVAERVNASGGLLGFAIGFPATTSTERVWYRLNKVKQREIEKSREPEEDNEFEDA